MLLVIDVFDVLLFFRVFDNEKMFLHYPSETDTFRLKSRQSIGDTAGNENVMNAGIAGDAPSMSSSSSLAIEALVLKIS